MIGREDYERAEREREFVERAQRGDALARAMYEAYTKSSGGLNYQGKPCPKWDELPAAICGHWQAAANVARIALKGVAP